MATRMATAIEAGKDSFKVGRAAAEKALLKLGGGSADFLAVFVSTAYQYGEVLRGIGEVSGSAAVVGCSTAGEFNEEGVYNRSVACAAISSDEMRFHTSLGRGLAKDEDACFQQAVRSLPLGVEGYPHRSLVMLIDGLAGKGEEASLLPVLHFGSEITVAGGAAADDYLFKESFVFHGHQAERDALCLTLISSRSPLAVGIAHGHHPITPAFKVTRAQGNRVYELDGQPAVELWLKNAREHARQVGLRVERLWEDEQALSKFTCIFEGGLDTGQGFKVRWTGMRSDTRDHLPFSCTIPEGSMMRIMTCTDESLIESAENAAKNALSKAPGSRWAGALVFDCAVRGATLGNKFGKAVEGIRRVLGPIPFLGLETYGEIGLESGQLSGFHNTTTVVLLIPG